MAEINKALEIDKDLGYARATREAILADIKRAEEARSKATAQQEAKIGQEAHRVRARAASDKGDYDGAISALSELILEGQYVTLDLSRFGYERIARNQPIVEENVV